MLLCIISCTAAVLLKLLNLAILNSQEYCLPLIHVYFYCRESEKKGLTTETGKMKSHFKQECVFFSFFSADFSCSENKVSNHRLNFRDFINVTS